MVDDLDVQRIEDSLLAIARALNRLGNADASTPMGGLEALGAVMKDGMSEIAASIECLAEAIDNSGRKP